MDKALTSELTAGFVRVTVPNYEAMARRWGWFNNQEEIVEPAPSAFLEARLNELEAENARLRSDVDWHREHAIEFKERAESAEANLKNHMYITASLGTKNCELRKKLRLLGHPEEPFDDGAKA